jgi:NCS1 family nucleobase:cation symporter-1
MTNSKLFGNWTDAMALDTLIGYLKVPDSEDHISNVWINDDIRPLPPHRRTWTRWALVQPLF